MLYFRILKVVDLHKIKLWEEILTKRQIDTVLFLVVPPGWMTNAPVQSKKILSMYVYFLNREIEILSIFQEPSNR